MRHVRCSLLLAAFLGLGFLTLSQAGQGFNFGGPVPNPGDPIEVSSNRNIPNGLATLDGNAQLIATQIPPGHAHTVVVGVPGPGACGFAGEVIVDSVTGQQYGCAEKGANPLDQSTSGDGYVTFSDGTNTTSASGAETFRFAGTDCIAATVATGTPDKVTHKISCTSQAQGDVLYFNGINWVRLAPGTSGQFLKTQGAAANPVWADASAANAVSVQTRDLGFTEVTNTTVETDLFSYVVPGNTLGTNKCLRLTIQGRYASGTSTNITLRIAYGATSGTIAFSGVNDTDRAWSGWVMMCNKDATNNQQILGTFERHLGSHGAVNLNSAIDSTVNQTFAYKVTWSVAAANNLISKRFAILELLP